MQTQLIQITSRIICLLAISMASYGKSLPLFKVEYDATIKGFAIKATRELKPLTDKQFTLHFQASSWAAEINETAVFQWQDNHIQPYRYSYSQSILGKNKQQSILFDHNNATAAYLEKGNTSNISLLKNTFDKLSYQLQLQLDVSNNKTLGYKVISKGYIKDYHFEILDEEIIDTKAGKLTAIKVKVIRSNKDKVTYIWFAKDWEYLLTKLEQYEGNKKKFTILLNNAVVNQQTVKGLQ
ncbi:hypothetical protein AB835_00330 [Candidatus Endobugula sertula]|uniref:DUF3108 domain-containing protein n=1 Tax=Candidatus Endobugula sertula TaxID=62101 RepID=A0A1D2QTU2_9GAMM|nr:hypothetical protein AB835_00330 [Candidatus Endobugula sertula]